MSYNEELLKAIRETEIKHKTYTMECTKERLDTYTNISDERKNALKDLVSLYDVLNINKAPVELSEDENWYFYLWRQYCRCDAIIKGESKQKINATNPKESFIEELRKWHHKRTIDMFEQKCEDGYEHIKNENMVNKYLIITDNGFATYSKGIKEAKEEAARRIEEGLETAYIYEKKLIVGVTKPEIEFKEV